MTFFRDPEKPSREVPGNLEGHLAKFPGLQIADPNARHPIDEFEPVEEIRHPEAGELLRRVSAAFTKTPSRELGTIGLKAAVVDFILNAHPQGVTQAEFAAEWGVSKQRFWRAMQWAERVFGFRIEGQRNDEHRELMSQAMRESHRRRKGARVLRPAPHHEENSTEPSARKADRHE